MNIAQETVDGDYVLVHFAAGEWARVKHLFAGTSAAETVAQNIPDDAAVYVRVKATELAAAKAADQEAPLPVINEIPPAPPDDEENLFDEDKDLSNPPKARMQKRQS